MNRLSLSLLGQFQVTLDAQIVTGFDYAKVRALLTYLAVEADHPHRRDVLATLLWPDHPDAAARKSLRQALTTLRAAIADETARPPFLLVSRDEVQFNPVSDYSLDVATFTTLLHECDTHLHPGLETCPSCLERLAQAAALYHGDFVAGLFLPDSVEFEEWALLLRERLHRHATEALGHLALGYEQRGEAQAAESYAERLLALEPWAEEAHRCLMRVLVHRGQRAAALAQYERCRRVLADELGIEPSEETTALFERIRAGKEKPGNGRTTPATQRWGQLPTPPTPLIGRGSEVVRVREALVSSEVRLLTLLGPPGVGKTRLSLAAAFNLVSVFADGVCWVPLAPITDPTLVASAIAQSLGVQESSRQTLMEGVKQYLYDKHLLIVLDNFEQVLDAAPVVSELLAATPRLKTLITSRAALGLYGEHEFPVSPLSLPDLTSLPPVNKLAQVESIALFLQRARAVQHDFVLTVENASAIAGICVRLDGLPLAIELAAARVKQFTPLDLLARLDNRLTLLTDGPRDLPMRHRRLRDTLAWSYDLLNPVEQTLFQRLSVFVGGWTLEAAEKACAGEPVEAKDMLEELTQLANKSLVVMERASSGVTRYRQLETIRQYGWEQLEAGGAMETVRRQHAEFFAALVEEGVPFLETSEQDVWLARLEQEHDNLRAALQWSRASGEVEQGLRLGASLVIFWFMRGYLTEGRERLLELLNLSDKSRPTSLRAKALDRAGFLARFQGDYEAAYSLIDEGLAIHRALGDQHGVADSLANLGFVTLHQGHYPQAHALYDESLAINRALHNRQGIADSLSHLALIAFYQGNYATARALDEESLALWRALGDKQGIAWALTRLGNVRLHLGDDAVADRLFRESLTIAHALAFQWGLAASLEGLAGVAARRNQPERALRLAGTAEALRGGVGMPLSPANQSVLDRTLEPARNVLGQQLSIVAWVEGRAMTLEQAVAYALEGE